MSIPCDSRTSAFLSGTEVFLAFGSNKGDPRAVFQLAIQGLTAGGFAVGKISPLYKTAPVDCEEDTPPFLNAVLCGFWKDSPEALLKLCQQLERQAGRPEIHSSRQARELDLDIILFGEKIIRSGELTVPHPRAFQRAFVLVPLHDLAPEAIFPDSGKSVAQLLRELPCPNEIEPYPNNMKENKK